MKLSRAKTFVSGLAVVAMLGLSACGGDDQPTPGTGSGGAGTSAARTSATPTTKPVRWVTTPPDAADDVAVDTRVVASAEDGTLIAATLTYVNKKGKKVPVKGWLESGTWTSSDLLEPGVTYTLELEGTDETGQTTRSEQTFKTAALTLDDQIYVKIQPDGGTVGIGMPVIVTFDLPVKDKASFEKHMKVTAKPAQEGSWYWLSSREAHWRPKSYWVPGSKVHVEANLNGVPAGGDRYGELSRTADFTVGRSVVAKVNLQTHYMDVFVNGAKAKSIPISGGRPGWETRSGVKVIMEKRTNFKMKAESIGLKEGDKDYYEDVIVKHALRITHSGEFLHTAPWSVAQQGKANVSHGCTGMSEASSDWVFANMRVGDVVETTGSDKPMTMGNGYADWNLSWSSYQKGSAL